MENLVAATKIRIKIRFRGKKEKRSLQDERRRERRIIRSITHLKALDNLS